MANRTPNLQERSFYHHYWGQFAGATALPNASGAALSDPEFSKLEAGDFAYDTLTQTMFVCRNPGSVGGADATWRRMPAGPQIDRTAALNQVITTLGSEVLLGGFVFHGANSPGGLSPLVFRLEAALNVSTTGDGEMRLYDLGTPGSIGAGTLRSTLAIANGEAGAVVVKENTLSVVGAPGVDTDEIFDTQRVYEVRGILQNANSGDSLDTTWAGFVIG